MLTLLLALAVAQSDAAGVEVSLPLELSELGLQTPDSPRQVTSAATVYCLPVRAPPPQLGSEVQVSCDPSRRECLVAPMFVLDEEGQPTSQPVQRTTCERRDIREDLRRLKKEGFRFLWARAEAPPGWYRDERGRIMQANFDFTRRIWVGGGYSPFFRAGEAVGFARGRVDLGIAVSFKADRFLHQLRFIDSNLWVGNETRFELTLVRYWWNVKPLHPPLFVTTFVGQPRRFDLPVSLSTAVEGLRLEVLPQRSFLTLATGSLLMDLWHSDDLESYLRLRAGVGAEVSLGRGAYAALRPEAAAEADFTLDRHGFHHLTASVTGEKVFLGAGGGAENNPWRLRAKLGYEVILLAINDYPLTLVVDGRATWRQDLPTAPSPWDFNAHAGLRMSFWAPARRSAPPMGPPAPDAP
jgi:hypothetical protein